jgi:hypothetical protein
MIFAVLVRRSAADSGTWASHRVPSLGGAANEHGNEGEADTPPPPWRADPLDPLPTGLRRLWMAEYPILAGPV